MELGTYGKLERGAKSATELGMNESATELSTCGMERGAESAMELGTNEKAKESPCRGATSCTATENPHAAMRWRSRRGRSVRYSRLGVLQDFRRESGRRRSRSWRGTCRLPNSGR